MREAKETLESLLTFYQKRAPAAFGDIPEPHNGVPCLAEDWWVEEKLKRRPNQVIEMDPERGLRAVWRWARMKNLESALEGRGYMDQDAAADLLLHQMNDLPLTLFAKAEEIFRDQQMELIARKR